MSRLVAAVAVIAVGFALTQLPDPPAPPQDLSATPLYQLSETQLDQHLRFLAASEPDPVRRLARLAEQAIGQPHEPAVLGEGPYDPADARPMYAIDRADNTSFVEQTLAMAVASDFESFFLVLQALRYKGGRVSTATRNHNLLADWPGNAQFLLDDLTESLAGGMAWVPVHQIVQRKAFLQQRFHLAADVPDEKFTGTCIPRVYLYKVLPELRAGDVVLVITGNDRQQFCQEIGLMLHEPADAEKPLRLLESLAPAAAKTVFRDTVIARKDILGFKFLRLRGDAVTAAAAQAERMRTLITPS